jgi:acetyl esterase/lipase
MARALADLGGLVATPEYRRVGNGGGWPTTGEDVHLAVSRLPELLAGLDLPTGPLTVTGHSAGGHLALWLATTDLATDLASEMPVGHVVALAPVCDLGEAIRQGLGSDATQALLAGADPGPVDPMTLFDVRPAAEVAVVHGDQDEDVPVSLSRGFVAAHPWVRLTELPGVGHMELIDPASAAWPAVVDELQRGA